MRKASSTFAKIGQEFELSEDTVRKIWSKQEKSRTTENAQRPGRPLLLDKHDIRRLKSYIYNPVLYAPANLQKIDTL